jgi:hypothetical protein
MKTYPRLSKLMHRFRSKFLSLLIARLALDFVWLMRALRPRQCEIWILYSTSHIRLCSAYSRSSPSCNIFPMYWGPRISQTFIYRELPNAQGLSLSLFIKTVLLLCISPLNHVRVRVPYISDFNLGFFSEVMFSGTPSHAVVFYDDGPVTFLKETLGRRMLLPPILSDFVCWDHPYDRSGSLLKRQVPLKYFIKPAAASLSIYPSSAPEKLRHLVFLESKYMNFPKAFSALEYFSKIGNSFYDFMPSPHFTKNWASVPPDLLLARSSYEFAEDHIINSPSSQVIVASALSSTVLVILELLRQGLSRKNISFFICLDIAKCKDPGSLRELYEFEKLMRIRYKKWVSCSLDLIDVNSGQEQA